MTRTVETAETAVGTDAVRSIDAGVAAGAVRARLALPRARSRLPRRQAARDQRVRHQARRVRDLDDGTLHVLDGYCRHMGGDLTQGTIKDDAIACPFHDWRWSGEGRCVGIPYAKRVPLRARTRAWTTMEKNGQLFVWNDPEGNPPPPEVEIPDIEGVGSDDWSDWVWTTLRIEGSNCREIIDNVSDMAHFYYVHFAFPTYFKNVFEGHVATQYMESRGRPDIGHGRPVRRRGQPAQVRGVLLRAVLHDQLAVERLQGARRSSRSW